MKRPSRNEPSRLGASRKSSAERDGGVSTTMRSQVPSRSASRAQLAELLHRHVLLGARERAGDRLVEGVGQDLRGLVGGGVRLDDLVEGALHVEHHRVQRPAGLVADAGHRARGVVELGEPERLGQPPRRVDGEHDDAAPGLGRAQAERGRRGGLADAAGAAADDDAGGGVGQQGVDADARRAAVRAACAARDERAVLPERAAISAPPGRSARRRAPRCRRPRCRSRARAG